MIEVLARNKKQKQLHPIKGVDVTYYNRDKFIAISCLSRETYMRLISAKELVVHIDDFPNIKEEEEEDA